MDSSSSAYGRPKTPKSMGLGMPGTRGLMDEPTSMGNGDGASGVDGFDVYPPQGASVEAANSGFVYSTTLRRQASTDYVPGRTRSRSPVTYRDHDYTAYTPRARSASLRESIEGVAESGVLGKVASSIRKAVGADEVPYQRLAASSEAIKDFSTHPTNGLSNSQLPSLVSRYGLNEFEVPDSEHLALKFAKQVYENPLILLLLGSALVSALLGSYDDAVCVVIAVTIVLTVGFVQEQRSEKSLEALNKLVPHYCNLIRNGQPVKPLANALVPGDLITFTVGDRVPADVRLISAVGLEIDESALTGETKPAKKRTEQCGYIDTPAGREGEGVSLGGRKCVAFMGTLVRSGHGRGIVVGTGTDSEFGSIFAMMQDVEEKRTPLQVAMDDLAKRLSIFSFIVIGVIFLIGVIQKRGWLEMFTIGVSLAVAAIPEGLPIVTTVTLALGVLRMSRRKAIVKKLPSVEALGSVSVICSDKTGTLTKNEMTVTHLYAVDDMIDLAPHLHRDAFAPKDPNHPPFTASPAMLKVAQIGTLCNNAFKNDAGINVGQATEVALLNVLPVLEKEDDRKAFTRKSEVPFSSERKVMSVIGSMNGGSDMVYMKGAPEAVLSRCRYFYVSDSSTPSLDAATQKMILDRALSVQKRGLRVIGMAYGFPGGAGSKGNVTGEEAEKDLVFVGFEAMLDPPRRGVAHAIAALQQASVQVVMITGDSEPTALAIARELGMKVSNPTADGSHSSSCLLGSQIDTMSERELIERVPHVTVYARTTPRHKMAIVKAWQMRGAVVAMTGDGVNDSPALKMADIGISMGKSGTDVAKEAADVILVDDDFSSILPAVEEGKSIFYNIQNFLSFQLSTAVAALGLITLSTMLELANPLNAMQILFINILMDGPPAQALGVDPVDKEIMRRPPRKKTDQIISRRLLGRVAFSASMIMLGTLWIYAVELSDGTMSRRDQTMTFTCFVFLDLVSALQNRGLSCPLFRNRMLFLTVSVSLISQLGLVYIPLLQSVFQTEALGLRDLMTLLGLAATSMGAHEGRRWYERKLVQEEFGRNLSGGGLV